MHLQHLCVSRAFLALALAGALLACDDDHAGSPADAGTSSTQRRIVLLVGDAFGLPVITATRVFAKGEEGALGIDRLPEAGYLATHSGNALVPDCAGAMTAMLSGVKTPNGVLGLAADGGPVASLVERAEAAAWATGIVTTGRLTGSTAAAAYAHGVTGMGEDFVAPQLLPRPDRVPSLGDGIDVLVGGGGDRLLPTGVPGGGRADGRNLIAELAAAGYATATTPSDLAAALAKPGKLLAVLAPGPLPWQATRVAAGEPGLAALATTAYDRLTATGKDFVLVIEGARIKHALDASLGRRALEESAAFDDAIAAMQARIARDDPGFARSLLIATADHDHTLVLNGYAARTGPTTPTNPGILGLVRNVRTGMPDLDAEGQTYAILGFGNGVRRIQGPRGIEPLDEQAMTDPAYAFESTIAVSPERVSNGGADVFVGAAGVGAAALRGFVDNTKVHDVMAAFLGGTAAPSVDLPAPARAKNVVLFLGDGMGVPVHVAARIHGKGEAGRLALETLPHVGRVKTASADAQTTDSAPSMTAYTTGAKTNNDVIAMDATTTPIAAGCPPGNGAPLPTILELAKAKGLAVGTVTTTELTHATPAATYAHICHRDRQFEIAVQAAPGAPGYNAALGTGVDVLMGGGLNHFAPVSATLPNGRADGLDLVGLFRAAGYAVVADAAQLAAAPSGPGTKLLGLFSNERHLAYEIDRDPKREPSLADMTIKALEVLRASGGERGFFLMVEGGRIDHALHDTQPVRAIGDVLAFDAAVSAVLAGTSADDTLVIVTADHDHTMTIAGNAKRGTSLLGPVIDVGTGTPALDVDGLPYPVLVFGNGEHRPDRRSATDAAEIGTPEYHHLGGVRRKPEGETHGATDVAIAARGPGGARVRGTLDNTAVFTIMKEALGL